MRDWILWSMVGAWMSVPASAQGQCEKLSVQYGKDLLAAFSASWTSPIELRYRTIYSREGTDVRAGDWLIRGELGRWDSRRTKRDAKEKNIVSVRVERDGLIYDVSRSKTGWEATISKRRGAMTFDSLCPLQRYVSAVGGKAWPDAMYDHAPVEAWRSKRQGESFVVLRMPLLPDYLDVIKKGGVVRNFLCWEVWLQRADDAGLRIRRVLGLASAQVSDVDGPPGRLVDNHRALACEAVLPKFGNMACVVVQRLQFGRFQTIRGRSVPGTMSIETSEGCFNAALEGLVLPEDPIPDSAYEFRAPAEFGVVGRLHDARTNKATHYGEWPGKESKVLNALVDNGNRLFGRQAAPSAWPKYLLFVLAMMLGVVAVLLWGDRARGIRVAS